MSDRIGQAARDDATAPGFRVWPPVSIAVPWLAGWGAQSLLGIPTILGAWAAVAGWVLILGFAVWNGWCLVLFARHRTGLLPGQPSNRLLESGPYRLSRNPLYVGLLALYVGGALLADSAGALVLAPLAWAGLQWGAVLPEERYLRTRLGEPYLRYSSRVRRWL